ncbi:MAG TPA: Stp1/IreP family PP2C-type Ser/Thr phosphatase [Chitinophagaceae bacterium]|nr:Stp1/IreP family PP2C-type Ser/Thr phosphatase [Chitinophagaceae bacterium]HPH32677.1 Stp1/IreP family PP2C-type Ser/Thr phosphatase [Chitinophagaceae bacterium]HPN58730.1 Stp1/IreP family PP2C-type Ser/Thr phosphatase [Chitinophagaceae bacterium]
MFWKKLFTKNKQSPLTEKMPATGDTPNLQVVVRSDLGNIRTNNEDTGLFYRIADEKVIREKGCLLMVADGMGGHQAGEVASRMASEIIIREYFSPQKNGGIEKNLRRAFIVANTSIHQAAASNKEQQGMGTTCTALVVTDPVIHFAHVGDSRAYLLKKGGLSRITEDHTYVQELVRSGEITAAEADTHPQRNILTNAMGTKADMKVDAGRYALLFETGDRLMLCSDGLYDYLNDDEIAAFLGGHDLTEAAEQMIVTAKKRGGHDNITVVLAQKKSGKEEVPARETRDFDLPVTKELDLP